MFSAMVKADGLTGGGRPLAFSISSYDGAGKAIRTYETVLDVPLGTYDWQAVRGQWQAPDSVAEILFWVVKWGKSGVTGTVWFDDMQLCEAGRGRNVIPNGGIEQMPMARSAAGPCSTEHGWTAIRGAEPHPSSADFSRRIYLKEMTFGPLTSLISSASQ